MHVGHYITYMNNSHISSHVYLLAHVSTLYKLTYCRCDMHMLCILINNYCIISLFAEMDLHVGQVPMLVLNISHVSDIVLKCSHKCSTYSSQQYVGQLNP